MPACDEEEKEEEEEEEEEKEEEEEEDSGALGPRRRTLEEEEEEEEEERLGSKSSPTRITAAAASIGDSLAIKQISCPNLPTVTVPTLILTATNTLESGRTANITAGARRNILVVIFTKGITVMA